MCTTNHQFLGGVPDFQVASWPGSGRRRRYVRERVCVELAGASQPSEQYNAEIWGRILLAHSHIQCIDPFHLLAFCKYFYFFPNNIACVTVLHHVYVWNWVTTLQNVATAVSNKAVSWPLFYLYQLSHSSHKSLIHSFVCSPCSNYYKHKSYTYFQYFHNHLVFILNV